MPTRIGYDGMSPLTAASYLENDKRNNHFSTSYKYNLMGNILNELNKQGFNYGERLNYKAIPLGDGNIIPFNNSALTSLKFNDSMCKKAYYIIIK